MNPTTWQATCLLNTDEAEVTQAGKAPSVTSLHGGVGFGGREQMGRYVL